MNWRPAAGSQEEVVVHGAGEAAQQKQQTWGSASAYRQVTLAAEKGAREDGETHDRAETAWRSRREA